MAATIASTLAASRPSEKLGTHSTSVVGMKKSIATVIPIRQTPSQSTEKEAPLPGCRRTRSGGRPGIHPRHIAVRINQGFSPCGMLVVHFRKIFEFFRSLFIPLQSNLIRNNNGGSNNGGSNNGGSRSGGSRSGGSRGLQAPEIMLRSDRL